MTPTGRLGRRRFVPNPPVEPLCLSLVGCVEVGRMMYRLGGCISMDTVTLVYKKS